MYRQCVLLSVLLLVSSLRCPTFFTAKSDDFDDTERFVTDWWTTHKYPKSTSFMYMDEEYSTPLHVNNEDALNQILSLQLWPYSDNLTLLLLTLIHLYNYLLSHLVFS